MIPPFSDTFFLGEDDLDDVRLIKKRLCRVQITNTIGALYDRHEAIVSRVEDNTRPALHRLYPPWSHQPEFFTTRTRWCPGSRALEGRESNPTLFRS